MVWLAVTFAATLMAAGLAPLSSVRIAVPPIVYENGVFSNDSDPTVTLLSSVIVRFAVMMLPKTTETP